MDSDAPPHGFVKISDAFTRRDGKTYDVIGVVSDYLPAARSRGSDFTMKVTLWDLSCSEITGLSNDGMAFRFFHRDVKKLPSLDRAGDILLLRNVKTHNQGSSWSGISNFATTWVIVDALELLSSVSETASDVTYRTCNDGESFQTQGRGPKPDMSEMNYAKQLLQVKDPRGFTAPPPMTSLTSQSEGDINGSAPRKMKYRMVKDLNTPANPCNLTFADLFGEIRKIFVSGNNVIELSITDYTENSLLYNYVMGNSRDGDEFSYIEQNTTWAGPWGRMTIVVSVWDEHATFVRNAIRDGDLAVRSYLLLQNVHIRMDRNQQYLQGHCRGGGRAALAIFRPREAEGDQRFKELLRRRQKYQVQAEHDGLPFDQLVSGRNGMKEKNKNKNDKSKLDDTSARQRRNLKNREKNKHPQQQMKEATDSSASRFSGADGSVDGKGDAKISSNQHIRCENINVPLKSVADILEQDVLKRTTPKGNEFYLPFQNCNYRSKVKVYDFYPDRLEDFAIPQPISEYEALSDYESEGEPPASISFARCHPERVKWIWHFYLLVGDPPSKLSPQERPLMLLQIANQDGEYLLNAEACDLRRNTDELAKLKEKLFVMWGDLQEKKEETGKNGEELQNEGLQISCRPFECFIKEYGVNGRTEEGEIIEDQYERMFRMFGTRIC